MDEKINFCSALSHWSSPFDDDDDDVVRPPHPSTHRVTTAHAQSTTGWRIVGDGQQQNKKLLPLANLASTVRSSLGVHCIAHQKIMKKTLQSFYQYYYINYITNQNPTVNCFEVPNSPS
jgi:hypothetical protein